VQSVVAKALTQSPDLRWQTAAEMQKALEKAMIEAQLTTTTSDVAAFAATHLAERAAARKKAIDLALRVAADRAAQAKPSQPISSSPPSIAESAPDEEKSAPSLSLSAGATTPSPHEVPAPGADALGERPTVEPPRALRAEVESVPEVKSEGLDPGVGAGLTAPTPGGPFKGVEVEARRRKMTIAVGATVGGLALVVLIGVAVTKATGGSESPAARPARPATTAGATAEAPLGTATSAPSVASTAAALQAPPAARTTAWNATPSASATSPAIAAPPTPRPAPRPQPAPLQGGVAKPKPPPKHEIDDGF
jgi:hypothetical protein